MPYQIPAEYLHTTTGGASPQTRTSHQAGQVAWNHALSLPPAASGNVAQVPGEEAGCSNGECVIMPCPGDSSAASSSSHAICMFVRVHEVRLMLVLLCNAVAGWDSFCFLMSNGPKDPLVATTVEAERHTVQAKAIQTSWVQSGLWFAQSLGSIGPSGNSTPDIPLRYQSKVVYDAYTLDEGCAYGLKGKPECLGSGTPSKQLTMWSRTLPKQALWMLRD